MQRMWSDVIQRSVGKQTILPVFFGGEAFVSMNERFCLGICDEFFNRWYSQAKMWLTGQHCIGDETDQGTERGLC